MSNGYWTRIPPPPPVTQAYGHGHKAQYMGEGGGIVGVLGPVEPPPPGGKATGNKGRPPGGGYGRNSQGLHLVD